MSRRSFEELNAVARINSIGCGLTVREFTNMFDRASGPHWSETGVCVRTPTGLLLIKSVRWNIAAQQIEIVTKKERTEQ